MKWYCVHTRPQKEARVTAYLQHELGLETYLPQLRQHRTIRRVRRIVTGPLFPRYLFCRFEAGPRFRGVRYAPDVVDIVNFGRKPAIVDQALIDELRSWAGAEVDLVTLLPGLRPGDRVEINAGPMLGMQAVIFREQSDRERVAVMLSILEGSMQKLLIDRSQLTRLA